MTIDLITYQSMRQYFAIVLTGIALFSLSVAFNGCGENPSAVDPDSVNDSTPPVCKIITPLNNDTVRNTVSIRTLCSDDKRVAKAEFLVNGAVVSSIVKAPWDFMWNTDNNIDGLYILQVRATDAAGNKTTSAEVQVRLQTPFTFYLVNTTYTTMSITAQGQSPKSIMRGDTAAFVYSSNPGTVSFTATTSGITKQGNQVGLLLDWSNTYEVSAKKSYLSRLVVSSEYFMLYLKNSGVSTFCNLKVNAGLQNETTDNILLPPDGVVYSIGYYKAFTNTEITMENQNSSGDVIYWKYNEQFTLPFTENQSITLFNSKYGIKPDVGLELKTLPPNESHVQGVIEKSDRQ